MMIITFVLSKANSTASSAPDHSNFLCADLMIDADGKCIDLCLQASSGCKYLVDHKCKRINIFTFYPRN